MGNTLTSASVAATKVISPVSEEPRVESKPHVHKTFEGEPPPECPMHKPKPAASVSECPIAHSAGDDINPLNMVSAVDDLIRLKYLMY